ncbi:MAG: LEA type 2 family protein [Gammaproteobacteria bacterium]|nr:LEA type 2 family protein [Gammaproteobacteria bacterium]MDH3767206.1 LEA type 2 family protein [Gammaproteobacteria bacterium]
MSRSQKRFTFMILGIFASIMLLASLSGCSTLQSPFQQPVVKLANVQLVELGLLQQTYGVTLQVDNPNGYTLPIKGVTYAVKLAGQDFASGLTPNGFSIPANGSDQVQVEVRTNLLESLGHLGRMLADGPQNVDYELNGDIQIDLPLIGAIPFSRSGTIPLTRRADTEL